MVSLVERGKGALEMRFVLSACEHSAPLRHALAEMMDLIRPQDPEAITLADLQRCGAGGTAAGLLLDVQARLGWLAVEGALGPREGLLAFCCLHSCLAPADVEASSTALC